MRGGCLLSVSQATISVIFWLSLGGTGEKLNERMGEREENYSLISSVVLGSPGQLHHQCSSCCVFLA